MVIEIPAGHLVVGWRRRKNNQEFTRDSHQTTQRNLRQPCD